MDPGLAASLSAYLAELHDEDWRSEFKSATNDINHGLREAVAALANHEGGELFLGIRDVDRGLEGTRLRKVDLPSRLRQEGTREDGFSLDLSPLAEQTTEVPLADPDRRVLVIEVRKALLPALIREDDETLAWYVRSGDSNRKLEPLEWVRRLGERSRGRLLLELYREYKGKVDSIPHILNFDRLDPEIFRLPRYEEARKDGSIYSLLTTADCTLLVAREASPQTGAGGPGLLERYLREGRVLIDAAERELGDTGRLSEQLTGNALRVYAMNVFPPDVAMFRTYMLGLGVLSPT